MKSWYSKGLVVFIAYIISGCNRFRISQEAYGNFIYICLKIISNSHANLGYVSCCCKILFCLRNPQRRYPSCLVFDSPLDVLYGENFQWEKYCSNDTNETIHGEYFVVFPYVHCNKIWGDISRNMRILKWETVIRNCICVYIAISYLITVFEKSYLFDIHSVFLTISNRNSLQKTVIFLFFLIFYKLFVSDLQSNR